MTRDDGSYGVPLETVSRIRQTHKARYEEHKVAAAVIAVAALGAGSVDANKSVTGTWTLTVGISG